MRGARVPASVLRRALDDVLRRYGVHPDGDDAAGDDLIVAASPAACPRRGHAAPARGSRRLTRGARGAALAARSPARRVPARPLPSRARPRPPPVECPQHPDVAKNRRVLWTLNVQSRTAIAGRGPSLSVQNTRTLRKNPPGVLWTLNSPITQHHRGHDPRVECPKHPDISKNLPGVVDTRRRSGPVIAGRATRRRAHPGAHPRTHPSVRRESTPKCDTQYQHARYWEP